MCMQRRREMLTQFQPRPFYGQQLQQQCVLFPTSLSAIVEPTSTMRYTNASYIITISLVIKMSRYECTPTVSGITSSVPPSHCLHYARIWWHSILILLVSFLASNFQTIFFSMWWCMEWGQIGLATYPWHDQYLKERVGQLLSGNTFFLAAFEFPQINYRLFNGKKYGIVYGVSSSNEDAVSRTFCHADCISYIRLYLLS